MDRPSGTLGCPIDELARMLGTWYVLGGGRSVAWALHAHCGVKKRLSARAQNRGCGKLPAFGPIQLEGIKKYPSGYSHFFYRACACRGWSRSQRTPVGQIQVTGPVAVGHRRWGHWDRANAAVVLFLKPAGRPPKPLAGCAGEPRRGRSWPGSHEHARATSGTRCRGLPEHPSAPGFKQSCTFY